MFFPSVDCLGAYVDEFGVGETVVGGFSRLGQGAYYNLAAVTDAANRMFLNFEKLQFAFSVIFLQVLLYTHKNRLRVVYAMKPPFGSSPYPSPHPSS